MRGRRQLASFQLDAFKKCFTYQGPHFDQPVEVKGVLLARWSIPRHVHLNNFPFLSYTFEKMSIRGFCPRCIQDKNKDLCKHTDDERVFETVVTTQELAYAVTQLSYQLHEVVEAYVYVQSGPIFRSFIQQMSSLKIRYQKVPAAFQNRLQQYCDHINEKSGFTHPAEILTPELLKENLPLATNFKLNVSL